MFEKPGLIEALVAVCNSDTFLAKATTAAHTTTATSFLTRLGAAKTAASLEQTASSFAKVSARRLSRRQSGIPTTDPEKKEESEADATYASELA